ncbi:acyl carrier protein [Salmonella enterica subsp. enterica serovar Eastbourne]|nr:acyl carrier protein [Salmonella enterica subsp. enterica serovar Eastbourne]EHC5910045.1 acyl carrier protein [Salmonella enterica subsp. enterica serovar Eastbourne]
MKIDMETLKEKLANILEVDVASLNDSTMLSEQEQWDSFAALSVVALLTEYTGKQITVKEMESISTIEDLLHLFNDSKTEI